METKSKVENNTGKPYWPGGLDIQVDRRSIVEVEEVPDNDWGSGSSSEEGVGAV